MHTNRPLLPGIFILLSFIFILPLSSAAAADDARWGAPFLRYPTVSPDGRIVAFSYAGDIWTVPAAGGTARRITVNPAYDSHPVFSPTGDKIAFSSDRAGNTDIFVIDTAGDTEPRQLTYHGGREIPSGWTPDGKEVVFLAVRELSPRRLATPYRVPADGSRMPVKLMRVLAMHVAVSADGNTYAITRGYSPWYRKHYTGSGNYDIWLYNPADSSYSQFTGSEASELFPMFAGQDRRLYYISERDGTFNLYRKALDAPLSESGEQLTSFVDDGVRRYSISADGSTAVFSRGTDLYLMSLVPADAPKRIDVSLPADTRENRIAWETFTSDAESFAVSPGGKQAAVIVRGELFAIENVEDGITRRLSETVGREATPVWLPDSASLLFTSDTAGSHDIYCTASADSAYPELYRARHFSTKRLTNGNQDEHHPLPSPDGKLIAYVRGRGDLMVLNADGSGQHALFTGWDEPKFCWSPDSRWIAYSRNDIEFNEDVWIIPADGSSPAVNVTRHPDADSDPVWSADGRKLGFRSRRGENNVDVYFVFLRKDDQELSSEQRRWREADEEKTKKDDEKGKVAPVKIDFDRIHERIRQVSSLPGDEGAPAVSPDGQTFVFSAAIDGENDLYSIKWNGEDLTRLTNGGQGPSAVRFSPDGKTVYYMRSGGRPSQLTISDKKSDSLPLSARMAIDLRAERRQVFLEGWRVLNDYFYDPQFHGVDWAAMRDKYLPAVEAGIPARDDFDDLVSLMLGELNASHLGISSPGGGNAPVPVGALGVRLDETYAGPGFKISQVLHRGPADREQSRLAAGEVITSVAGHTARTGDNLYHLLYDTVNKPVLLKVRSVKGAEREVLIRPTSTGGQFDLVYDDWVEARRALVDSLSGGRLGYIHIRAMGWDSFEEFERDLFSECHDKEGLLVDVRNNGGGWTTDYLLAVLTVRRHAWTVPRGAKDRGYPQDRLPLYSWTRPVAALCNELSFSNAEIFSHAFKTLGLGPLVGQTTGGLVISTGATQLIDGTTFRIPFRGWYVLGSGENMEKHGAVPDVIVPEPPGEEGSGADSQLARAVRELLGRL